MLSNSVNIKSLRMLKVLRPLRTLKTIPSMRRLVTTLFKSLPEIFNASIFILFIIFLFSIMGL
jgi:voltage-gated sodium channel